MGNIISICSSNAGEIVARKYENQFNNPDNTLLLNKSNNNFSCPFKKEKKDLDAYNKSIENNIINTINNSNKKQIEERKELNLEEDNSKFSPESQDIEKGNDGIPNYFDNFIKDYARYIDDEEFKKTINPKIKAIEDNLEVIEDNFESEIFNLKLFKKGPLLFKDNNMIYEGSWNNNFEKEGFGISIDKNGNKYIGNWKDDNFNGKGRIISINGDYYEGDWKSGIIEGFGIFYSSSNNYKYEGTFKNNKFDGKGKLTYEKENIKYVGYFKNGVKEGKGKMIFGNKSKYEGQFKNDLFCGEGTFEWPDGRKYIGRWKNNCMEGIGEFIFDDNTRYKGEYKKNKREGKGVFYRENICYLGDWLNNMPHGKGQIFLNKKIIKSGIFRYGKLVAQLKGGENKSEKGNKSSKNSLYISEDKETALKSNSKDYETDSIKANGKTNKKNINNKNSENKQ